MLDDRVEQPLPEGWVWTRLGEVCQPPQYGWTTSAAAQGNIHLLRTTDITSGRIVWDTVPYCTEEPGNREKYLLHDGDIVISRAGSVGYSHLVKDPRPAVFASYLIRFRPLINERFVAYFLQSPSYWESISEKSLGIAIPNVNATKLRQIYFPLAPAAEQERIVARLEELLSDLEAGMRALERVRAGAKCYKASVLNAACEGKLTGVGAHGMRPSVQVGGSLPEGWRWVTIEDSCERIVDCLHSTAKFQESGFYCVDSNWIKQGKFVFEKARYVDEQTFIERNRRMKPQNGDVVFSREGALLGIAVRVPENLEFCLGQRMMIFRPSKNLDGSYLENVLNSENFRKKFAKQITGTASPHLNIGDIRQFTIPLPPLEEQRRIVAEVERRLEAAREVEFAVEAGVKRAARLRQAILRNVLREVVMAKRKRYKKTPKAEVKILQERNWVPVSLAGAAIPSWLSSIPQERLMAVYGSGTFWDYQILKYGGETHDNVVGGYDVFRYDAKDEPKGYPVNKDHYIVLNDTTTDDMYVVLGPTTSDHQWLTELPKIRPEVEITELPEDEEKEDEEKSG